MSDQSVQNYLYFRNIGYQYQELTQTKDSEHAIQINDDVVMINFFFDLVLFKPSIRTLQGILQIVKNVFDIKQIHELSQFMKSLSQRIIWDIRKHQRLLNNLKVQLQLNYRQLSQLSQIKKNRYNWTPVIAGRKVQIENRIEILTQKREIIRNILMKDKNLIHRYYCLQQKIRKIQKKQFNPYEREINQNNQINSDRNNKKTEQKMNATNKKQQSSTSLSKDIFKHSNNPYELEIKRNKKKSKSKNTNKKPTNERFKLLSNQKSLKKIASYAKSPQLNASRSSSSHSTTRIFQNSTLKALTQSK